MKICRYVVRDASASGSVSPRYGLIEGENVVEISGAPWGPWSRGPRSTHLDDVRLVAPVEPTKIVCIGRNYAAHAAEMGNEVPKEPLIFLKPPSALIGPEEAIVLPKYSQRVEHEGELAMVMGRRCAHLSDADDALSLVMGYTCLNDVTARDLQKSDVQFTRAKGFDTFCAIGELGPVPNELASLRVRTLVNGAVRQDGSASDMVFDIPALLAYISGVMTLEPGDLVLTGTPGGVGTLSAGDVVEVEVVGVSRVSNPVTSDH